jgi:AraC family transcriptional regulator
MEIKLSLGQIHQTIRKERLVAGFRLSESVYPPDLKTPMHSHQLACFCLVLSGASQQTYGLKSRDRKPNTMLFYPPDESHSERFGRTGSRIFSLEISPEWLQKVREFSTVRSESLVFEGGLLGWLAKRLYREFRHSDRVTPLAIEGIALEILAEVSRRDPEVGTQKPPRWLLQAKDLIHSQFAQDLSLGGIAMQVGVHPVYLASLFRKSFGCTVGEYVRKLRIEFAINELIFSDFPLAQIAVVAGFANQSHFNKVFKQQTGLTPGEYRAASRSS